MENTITSQQKQIIELKRQINAKTTAISAESSAKMDDEILHVWNEYNKAREKFESSSIHIEEEEKKIEMLRKEIMVHQKAIVQAQAEDSTKKDQSLTRRKINSHNEQVGKAETLLYSKLLTIEKDRRKLKETNLYIEQTLTKMKLLQQANQSRDGYAFQLLGDILDAERETRKEIKRIAEEALKI